MALAEHPVTQGHLPVHRRSFAGHVVSHARPAERSLNQEQCLNPVGDETRIPECERKRVAGSSAVSDHHQLLRPLLGDRQEVGADRLGILHNGLVRARIDDVNGLVGHASGPEGLGILSEVSLHHPDLEAADEDVTVPAGVGSDVVRDCQLALGRRVEPGLERGRRDRGWGRVLIGWDERRGETMKSPSMGSSLEVS